MSSQRFITRSGFLTFVVTSVFIGGCGQAVQSPPAVQVEPELSPEQEFAALTKKADSGDANAQINLGNSYARGEGVPKDAAKAVEWYQKAAAQGLSSAQYALGEAFRYGEGVPQSIDKAVEWYEKAVTQGDAVAQVALGMIYANGEGVPKNAAKAVDLFQKAAAQGNDKGERSLGWVYSRGLGVDRDETKAFYWFQRAAAQGNSDAMWRIGLLYSEGRGIPKDAAKAVEWFQKSAASGHPLAQSQLSDAYASGVGIKKDLVLAYAWINLVASNRHLNEIFSPQRSALESVLPPIQLAEAQRLSSNWKKGQILTREGSPTGLAQSVRTGDLSRIGTGTLFVVSKTGHAVTNQHVISGCSELRIQGRDGVAKLIAEDTVNDLALLQLQGAVKDAATIPNEPSKIRQGDDVVAFGFPLNSVLSSGGNLSPGVVSAVTGLGNNTSQIQITAPIQPGSSGSPVLNKKGEVVAVVSMKLSDAKMAKATGSVGQNVNFAVSGQTLKTFLDAHKVTYTTGTGFFSLEKNTADLADEARKWTFVVECWK